MLKFTKIIFAFFVLTMTMSNIACTKEDGNDKQQATAKANFKDQNIAENSADAGAAVYTLEAVEAAVKGKAVNFTWTENGKTQSFKELTKGKVVFLNFWGTWCPPCRKEIPDIIQLSKEMQNKDVIVIGMASERDPKTALDKVKEFVKSKSIPYINFIATQELMAAYGGINAVPTTFIIDKDGNIAETIVGAQSKEAFLNAVNRVLK